MKSKREIYFAHFYRIWKVGESIAEHIAFWKESFAPDYQSYTGPDNEELRIFESRYLAEKGLIDRETDEEILDAIWPTPQEIFIEKYYWEHGVVADMAGRLRYFASTFSETFEDKDISGFSESRKLSWCEWVHITAGHELEIDFESHFR